ncbi:MAG: hypothetical protein AAB726_03575 [Patescibacteria group bacterium]
MEFVVIVIKNTGPEGSFESRVNVLDNTLQPLGSIVCVHHPDDPSDQRRVQLHNPWHAADVEEHIARQGFKVVKRYRG